MWDWSKQMKDEKKGFDSIYDNIVRWIDDVKQHEVTDIVEVVDRVKEYLGAAESIPEEKVKQFVANLEYDLNEFYQQNQAEIKHSTYLGLLNETLWEKLAQMTDKSQVEWAELVDDFKHEGEYVSGDYVGFGVLQCCQCDHQVEISHLSIVRDCLECGGKNFIRLPLNP